MRFVLAVVAAVALCIMFKDYLPDRGAVDRGLEYFAREYREYNKAQARKRAASKSKAQAPSTNAENSSQQLTGVEIFDRNYTAEAIALVSSPPISVAGNATAAAPAPPVIHTDDSHAPFSEPESEPVSVPVDTQIVPNEDPPMENGISNSTTTATFDLQIEEPNEQEDHEAREKSFERAMELFMEAFEILSSSSPSPPLSDTQANLDDDESAAVKESIIIVAGQHGVDPYLALAVAHCESGFNPSAVSKKGARGIFQVMPETARGHFGIGKDQLFDTDINIDLGIRYLRYCLDRFEGDVSLALAAYNAGPQRVIDCGYRVPRISETRQYVWNVKRHRARYASNEKYAALVPNSIS